MTPDSNGDHKDELTAENMEAFFESNSDSPDILAIEPLFLQTLPMPHIPLEPTVSQPIATSKTPSKPASSQLHTPWSTKAMANKVMVASLKVAECTMALSLGHPSAMWKDNSCWLDTSMMLPYSMLETI